MPPREPNRPSADALLKAVRAEARGKLKIFLGAAPDVGKTFEMLREGADQLRQGRDVVAGIIETHGRAETQAQVGDLPMLPRIRVPYRGQLLEEFDLEAALDRRPGLLLVDELAHTNAPGSLARRRRPGGSRTAQGVPGRGTRCWQNVGNADPGPPQAGRRC